MTNSKPRKPGRPRTTGTSPAVFVSFTPDMLKAIDKWRDANADDFEEIGRPAAIRALVARGLKAKG